LNVKIIPIGMACVLFFETLGVTLSIAISRVVFENGVVRGVRTFVPDLDPRALLEIGATEIRDALARLGMEDKLDATLRAYMVGLVDTFRMVQECAVGAVIASWLLKWKKLTDVELRRADAAWDSELEALTANSA
jgi:hypothetical protein